MTKYRWKNIVKNTIHKNSFFKLEAKKQTHSKVKDLEHIRLEMQDYFMPNGIENMNKEEVQLIFKIRSKTTNVKMNRKINLKHMNVPSALQKMRPKSIFINVRKYGN